MKIDQDVIRKRSSLRWYSNLKKLEKYFLIYQLPLIFRHLHVRFTTKYHLNKKTPSNSILLYWFFRLSLNNILKKIASKWSRKTLASKWSDLRFSRKDPWYDKDRWITHYLDHYDECIEYTDSHIMMDATIYKVSLKLYHDLWSLL